MDARWLIIIPVAILFVLWLFSQVPWDTVLPTLAFIGVGFVLYILSRRGAVAQDGIELPAGRA